jgi:HlyD family secretion protein
VSWNSLQLLIKYTLRESMVTLDQEIANARLGLVSVRAANEAARVREAAELAAAESEYTLAKERLANYTMQIANATILAPEPGLVVYGRFDWDEPVYEGMSVRQGQDVVILPDIRKMVARLRVHEAQIDKVAKGQVATVKADAFPDRVFQGIVDAVATLPEQTRHSGDLKQYLVTVLIDGDNADGALRPGMSALVHIDVGVFRDVLHVPLPAVRRHDDAHYVFVLTPAGPVAKRVSLGRNSLTHVEVLGGLDEGERVMMVPPDEVPAGTAREPAGGNAANGTATSGN